MGPMGPIGPWAHAPGPGTAAATAAENPQLAQPLILMPRDEISRERTHHTDLYAFSRAWRLFGTDLL